MGSMHNCFLLLGSNQGNRLEILNRAGAEICDRIGGLISASSIYDTEAWGFTAEQSFFNVVLELETLLSAESVLEEILAIERDLGRVRNRKAYTSRLIDIDILFYDDEIINEPHLQVPHPRLQKRMFTLMPLTEKWPRKVHPELEKSMKQLMMECNDELMVKKMNEGLNLQAGN